MISKKVFFTASSNAISSLIYLIISKNLDNYIHPVILILLVNLPIFL